MKFGKFLAILYILNINWYSCGRHKSSYVINKFDQSILRESLPVEIFDE
jgi:hypothetical protein